MSDPPVTHGILPRKANPTRKELYVPADDLPWVEEASAALKRDGSSLSAWTLDQLKAWWGIHKPGNPQTGMERFSKVVATSSSTSPNLGGVWELNEYGEVTRYELAGPRPWSWPDRDWQRLQEAQAEFLRGHRK